MLAYRLALRLVKRKMTYEISFQWRRFRIPSLAFGDPVLREIETCGGGSCIREVLQEDQNVCREVARNETATERQYTCDIRVCCSTFTLKDVVGVCLYVVLHWFMVYILVGFFIGESLCSWIVIVDLFIGESLCSWTGKGGRVRRCCLALLECEIQLFFQATWLCISVNINEVRTIFILACMH
ncbi:hypothetical protein VNO80_04130 [Phaseolus coccineus]|uniref:Uncharacterized protein n=1 Tax=Phaseolus coccineus TaxID=3886 RepID=A0AAN9NY40_PHACN